MVYPRKYQPTKIIEVAETKKLYRSFEEYEKIHRVLNVSNVSELNTWIKSGNIGELIRYIEYNNLQINSKLIVLYLFINILS